MKKRFRKELRYYKFGKHEKILISLFLISVFADYLFSYIAYRQDTLYFIEHEVNREAVRFFVSGAIPFIGGGAVCVGGIFVIFFMLATIRESKEKFKNFPSYLYTTKNMIPAVYVFFFLYFFRRVLAGMTWHVNITDAYAIMYHMITYMWYGVGAGIFIILAALVIKMTYEEKKEKKNGSQTSYT